MSKYILKRIAMGILSVFIVATLTFFLMNLVPGGPFVAEKSISKAAQEALAAKFGLDKPLHQRYFTYMSDFLHGDMGFSLRQRGRTVSDIIFSKFPVSARLADLLRRPRLSYADLTPFDPDRPDLPPAVAGEAEITIKYTGYIDRQLRQVEEVKRLEERPMPEDIDYLSIEGLRLEARQKLAVIRPRNLGQAGRVSGVSPADVAVLMVYLKQREL